jgi:hypothetical protein
MRRSKRANISKWFAEIVYWTLNTFFPTLQLFFESGLSCTIEGAPIPDVYVGLDAHLRFRLTDLTYEEDGRVIKSIRPSKFANIDTGIAIKEASIATRTSIAVQPVNKQDKVHSKQRSKTVAIIKNEDHVVVGLKLQGMDTMGYVWAKASSSVKAQPVTWADVRIAGLREDVPSPALAFPLNHIKPGDQVLMTNKKSIVGNLVIPEQDEGSPHEKKSKNVRNGI